MDYKFPILSGYALEILADRGLKVGAIADGPEAGFRSLNVRSLFFLEPPLSLDQDGNVPEELLVPVFLQSPQALEFFQFTKDVAYNLWQDFQGYDAQLVGEECHLLDFIIWTIDQIPVADPDNFSDVLEQCGLSSTFRDRLLDPSFEQLRQKRRPKAWVKEMLDLKWNFLQTLDRSIKAKPELRLFRNMREMRYRRRTLYGSDSSIAVSMSNSRILFKAGTMSQLDSIFGQDGRLRLEFLVTSPPSDFSARRHTGIYFTDYEPVVREQVQEHKTLLGPGIKVGILQLAVDLLEWQFTENGKNLLSEVYDLTHDSTNCTWRSFIWSNRGNRFREPGGYGSYDVITTHKFRSAELADWIEGPICLDRTEDIAKMSSSEELTPMTVPGPGKVGRIMANQIFVTNLAKIRQLNQRCPARAWVTEA